MTIMAEAKNTKSEMPRYSAADRGVPLPPEVRKHRDALLKDYSQYVATETIYHDGAVAYREDDPVPASNVKLHGYDEAGVVKRVESN